MKYDSEEKRLGVAKNIIASRDVGDLITPQDLLKLHTRIWNSKQYIKKYNAVDSWD